MKQLIFLFSIVAVMAACGNDGDGMKGTDTIDNELDSIAYAMGSYFSEQLSSFGITANAAALTKGFSEMQAGKADVESPAYQAAMEQFQGALAARQGAPFAEGEALGFPLDSVSYVIGANFNSDMAGLDMKMSSAAFMQGIMDKNTGAESKVGGKEETLRNSLSSIMQERQQAKSAVDAEEFIAAGTAFIAEKAAESDVKSTPSGLHYKVLKPGTGASPASAADRVTVHYEGRLIDGTVFDSSIARGQPATFGLNQVIAGWTEGVQLMQEGSTYQFYIPYDLAYGLQGSPPNIPPGATLIFDVELIEIAK